MSVAEPSPPRARVAESRRNREALIEVATRAFASGDQRVPLEAIAKEAGVGIGTLYRHFSNREALVEAVYRDQVERLKTGADELLAAHAPAAALRLWMNLFADWVATKNGMLDTIRTMVSAGQVELGEMRAMLLEIITEFLNAGHAAGDLRPDAEPEDVAATLTGILTVAGSPDQHAQAGRMLDLLIDGLRPREIR